MGRTDAQEGRDRLPHLFSPLQLGELRLKHRIVLAPLTRQRADETTLEPQVGMHDEYYSQRATDGGLLITEATVINSESLGFGLPGIFTDAHVAAWKKVVDAVHAKGGLICMQLWHTGRIAHASFAEHPACDPERAPTRSASAVGLPGKTRGTYRRDKQDHSVPRPFEASEMPRLVADYATAARNAKRAGFDAVELHAAHGYLLDQFLNDSTNLRTDEFGGSFENRARLLLQVVEALGQVYPLGRVGVRLSPHAEGTMKYYGTDDAQPDQLYAHVIQALGARFPGLAYLLLTEPRWFGGLNDGDHTTDPGFGMSTINPPKFRGLYPGKVMGAGGFTPKDAEHAVASGEYDCIAMGRWFIANPDLVDRFRRGLPLNPYNRKTFYARGPAGYVDYPVYAAVEDKTRLVDQSAIGKSLSTAAKL